MIARLLNALAPPKATKRAEGSTGYRRLLVWAALPVTDRRWAAPLSAVALGFGLFAGIAIGPGAAGTYATGAAQIIELPGFVGSGGGGEAELGDTEEGGGNASGGSPSFSSGEEEPFASPIGGEESVFVPAAEEPTPVAEEAPEMEEKEAKPEGPELSGTVVHVNPVAGSYTVVEAGGAMSAVHGGNLPKPGTEITVPIRTLANGTLAEAGKRLKSGQRKQATLAGIVTFVDANTAAPAYAVSNRGSSVLVSVRPDASGALPSLPVLGTYLTVTAQIEPPRTAGPSVAGDTDPTIPPVEPAPVEPAPVAEPVPPAPAATPAPSCAPDPAHLPASAEPSAVLWQQRVSGGGAPFTHGEFASIVTAVCSDTSQLLVSADDVRAGGHDLLCAVPPSIDLGKVEPGQSVLLSADIAPDGVLSLTGLASDERLKGADNAKATQGDLIPEKPKGN
jgi:hypothetical protein